MFLAMYFYISPYIKCISVSLINALYMLSLSTTTTTIAPSLPTTTHHNNNSQIAVNKIWMRTDSRSNISAKLINTECLFLLFFFLFLFLPPPIGLQMLVFTFLPTARCVRFKPHLPFPRHFPVTAPPLAPSSPIVTHVPHLSVVPHTTHWPPHRPRALPPTTLTDSGCLFFGFRMFVPFVHARGEKKP